MDGWMDGLHSLGLIQADLTDCALYFDSLHAHMEATINKSGLASTQGVLLVWIRVELIVID